MRNFEKIFVVCHQQTHDMSPTSSSNSCAWHDIQSATETLVSTLYPRRRMSLTKRRRLLSPFHQDLPVIEVGPLQRLPAKHILPSVVALCHSSAAPSLLKPEFGDFAPFFSTLLSYGHFDGMPSLAAQAFSTPRTTVSWMVRMDGRN